MSRRASRRWSLAMALMLGAGWLGAARAAVPDAPCGPCQTPGGCCAWCLNDYCRKPLPAIPRTPCRWLCDLYGRKPLPALPMTPCQWYPNDYCPQPLVPVPRNCEPWYRCVPTEPNRP
jgi:hypothetical protein